MKKVIALVLYLMVFTFASADIYASQDRKATFAVEKMTCATCPITVRKAMQRVDGVKHVKVDFDTKTATVLYDAEMTSAVQIGESSGNVGFPASVIEDHSQ